MCGPIPSPTAEYRFALMPSSSVLGKGASDRPVRRSSIASASGPTSARCKRGATLVGRWVELWRWQLGRGRERVTGTVGEPGSPSAQRPLGRTECRANAGAAGWVGGGAANEQRKIKWVRGWGDQVHLGQQRGGHLRTVPHKGPRQASLREEMQACTKLCQQDEPYGRVGTKEVLEDGGLERVGARRRGVRRDGNPRVDERRAARFRPMCCARRPVGAI